MSQLLITPRTDAPAAGTAPALMDRVRRATRAQHDRCEARVNLAGLAASLEAYADALVTFLRLHEFVVANTVVAVAHAPAELGAGLMRGRARGAADLVALGRAPLRDGGVDPDETLSDLDGQLGAWYVLEGSALGGSVIARHVRGSLEPAAGALSYFTGEASATSARWRQFQAFANGLEARGSVQFSAVLRGAERTFDHLLSLPTCH